MALVDPELLREVTDDIVRRHDRGDWPMQGPELSAISARLAESAGRPLVLDVVERDGRIAIRLSAGGRPDAVLNLLSPREREVALLAARGLTNVQIATRLGISRATVKDHISNILRRMGLNRRVQLAAAVAPRDIEHRGEKLGR